MLSALKDLNQNFFEINGKTKRLTFWLGFIWVLLFDVVLSVIGYVVNGYNLVAPALNDHSRILQLFLIACTLVFQLALTTSMMRRMQDAGMDAGLSLLLGFIDWCLIAYAEVMGPFGNPNVANQIHWYDALTALVTIIILVICLWPSEAKPTLSDQLSKTAGPETKVTDQSDDGDDDEAFKYSDDDFDEHLTTSGADNEDSTGSHAPKKADDDHGQVKD